MPKYQQTCLRLTPNYDKIERMLAGILFIVLLACISFGLGRISLQKLPFNDLDEELVFSSGMGLGIISLGILILGLLKLLYIPVLVVLAILGFISSLPHLMLFLRKLAHQKFDRIEIVFILLLFAVVGIECVFASWHPLVFDELHYHLALPDTYLRNHVITLIPHNMYSNFPLLVEMLFIPALALKSILSCRLINLLLLALCSTVLFSMAKQHFNAKIALFSSLIFLGLPNVIMHSTTAYNDFGLVFYVLLSIYALINWQRKSNVSWLILSGIFCGLAIGAKYTGAINLLLLTLFIIISQKRIRPLIYFLAPCLVIVLPWLTKNMIFVNNPVYPFLYNIFGGKYWNTYNMERYLHILGSYGPKNLSSLLWYLIGEWGTDIPLGPMIFLPLPFIIFLRDVDAKIKYFLVYAILYFLIWLNTSPVIRFYLPPAALLCIVGGYTIAEYRKRNKIAQCLFIFLAVFSLFYYLWFVGTVIREGTPTIERESNEYLESIDYINQEIEPRSKILFIGEPRSFGAEKEIITSSIFDTAIIAEIVKSSKNTDEIAQKLKQRGITHLLLNEARLMWLENEFDYFNRQNRSQKELLIKFVNSPYLKLIKKINRIMIFKIVFD